MLRWQGLFGVIAVLVTSSCVAGTRLTDVWRSPQYQGPPLHTLIVFAQSPDPGHRRLIEDAYVNEFYRVGLHASASHVLLPQDQPPEAAVHDAVAASGADGLVLVQVTGVTQEVSPAPSVYFSADPFFWPAYGAGLGLAYGPGWTSDTVVRLSTRVYLADGQSALVFAATSRTFDPHSTSSLARDVGRHVVEEGRRQSLF